MIVRENGAWTAEYLAERERIEALKAERGETKPFEVGKTYQTVGGKTVRCIEVTTRPGYECARFDDGDLKWHFKGGYRNGRTGEQVPVTWFVGTTGWRYNRDGIDRGRCTGTPFDHSDPRCVIPESANA